MESNETTETERAKTRSDRTPRIYVASLADYNAGDLHGCWIDADQPVTEIQDAISRMLSASAQPVAEDWAIHDYENFGPLRLSEFEDMERVSEVACGIVEHGPLFAAVVNHFGGLSNLDEARRYMDDGCRGAFATLAEYAEELIGDCYADALKHLPEFIRGHIDWDGIGRDLELSGDIFTVVCDAQLYVFDSHI